MRGWLRSPPSAPPARPRRCRSTGRSSMRGSRSCPPALLDPPTANLPLSRAMGDVDDVEVTAPGDGPAPAADLDPRRYPTGQVLRLLARRHAAIVAVCGALLILLVAGIALGVRHILAERDRANRDAEVSGRV